jgi:hypothetical protein
MTLGLGRSRWKLSLALACSLTLLMGCATVSPPPTPPTTRSPEVTSTTAATSPTPTIFDDKKDGVRLQYTSDWIPRPDPDYVLQLVPADGSIGRRIILDVPDLPFHIPGMVQLGLVENGYLNDLKEKHKDLRVESSADYAIGRGAKARRVISTWTQNGSPHQNVALLIVRTDYVYILACGSDPAHLAATRADFDAVVESLQWTK